jgi:hypothetical protein
MPTGDLVPLMPLHSDARYSHGDILPPPPARHGGLLICYRLSELAAGRATAYGVKPEDKRPARRCGDSLLDVLHEYFADCHALDDWEIDQPWNRGFGAVGPRRLEQSHEASRRIDEIRALVYPEAVHAWPSGR